MPCAPAPGSVLRTAIASPVWQGELVVFTDDIVPKTLALFLKRSTKVHCDPSRPAPSTRRAALRRCW
jgi:hypothetical protein